MIFGTLDKYTYFWYRTYKKNSFAIDLQMNVLNRFFY